MCLSKCGLKCFLVYFLQLQIVYCTAVAEDISPQIRGYTRLRGNCPFNFFGICQDCYTVQGCAAACGAFPLKKCAGFSWLADERLCYLKRKTCPTPIVTNWLTYFYVRNDPTIKHRFPPVTPRFIPTRYRTTHRVNSKYPVTPFNPTSTTQSPQFWTKSTRYVPPQFTTQITPFYPTGKPPGRTTPNYAYKTTRRKPTRFPPLLIKRTFPVFYTDPQTTRYVTTTKPWTPWWTTKYRRSPLEDYKPPIRGNCHANTLRDCRACVTNRLCGNECNFERNRGCVGFVWLPTRRRCYLKTRVCVNPVISENEAFLYIHKDIESILTTTTTPRFTTTPANRFYVPPSIIEVPGFRIRNGNCAGNVLGPCNPCPNISSCADQCMILSDCAGFSWLISRRSCILKRRSCDTPVLKQSAPSYFYEKFPRISATTRLPSTKIPPSFPCKRTFSVAGDLIDNDCDGRIDEEACGDGIDNDDDGALDEDCYQLPEIHNCPPLKDQTSPVAQDRQEFMIMFMDHYVDKPQFIPLDVILVNSLQSREISVRIEAPGFARQPTQFETVSSMSFKKIQLSRDLRAVDTGVERKCIRVISDGPIEVIGVNRERNSAGAFRALPASKLGTEYFLVSSVPKVFAEFGIIALDDETEVTVSFPYLKNASTKPIDLPFYQRTYKNGQKFSVELSRYDVFHGQSAGDLTGTRIFANKPIAVFSGNLRANVGTSSFTGITRDHLVDMLPPTSNWGTMFFTCPTPNRLNGDKFIIVAKELHTVVLIGEESYLLSRPGDHLTHYQPSDTALVVTSNKPVMVALFTLSQKVRYSSEIADPSMTILTPVEQFLKTATVPAAFPDYEQYISLVTNQPESFTYLSQSGFSFNWMPVKSGEPFVCGHARVPSSVAVTNIESSSPFAALFYAVGSTETLSFSLGSAGLKLNSVNCDRVDTDCDGHADEEKCDGEDNDLDGRVDEDCCDPDPKPPVTVAPLKDPRRTTSANNPFIQPSRKPKFHSDSTRKPDFHPARIPGLPITRKQGFQPTRKPGFQPTRKPGFQPTRKPGFQPTQKPGFQPTQRPGLHLTRKSDFNPTRKSDFYTTRRIDIQPTYSSQPTPNQSHVTDYWRYTTRMTMPNIKPAVRCTPRAQLVVPDRIDNDCDNVIDEEYCDGHDDDYDGLIDEDCFTNIRTAPSTPSTFRPIRGRAGTMSPVPFTPLSTTASKQSKQTKSPLIYGQSSPFSADTKHTSGDAAHTRPKPITLAGVKSTTLDAQPRGKSSLKTSTVQPKICLPGAQLLIKDGLDNDCDGKVDEEVCDFLDDDKDGIVDEDCYFDMRPLVSPGPMKPRVITGASRCPAGWCLNGGKCFVIALSSADGLAQAGDVVFRCDCKDNFYGDRCETETTKSCVESKQQKVNDHIDNDCDSLIDEELCGDYQDNDGDGRLDEDCYGIFEPKIIRTGRHIPDQNRPRRTTRAQTKSTKSFVRSTTSTAKNVFFRPSTEKTSTNSPPSLDSDNPRLTSKFDIQRQNEVTTIDIVQTDVSAEATNKPSVTEKAAIQPISLPSSVTGSNRQNYNQISTASTTKMTNPFTASVVKTTIPSPTRHTSRKPFGKTVKPTKTLSSTTRHFSETVIASSSTAESTSTRPPPMPKSSRESMCKIIKYASFCYHETAHIKCDDKSEHIKIISAIVGASDPALPSCCPYNRAPNMLYCSITSVHENLKKLCNVKQTCRFDVNDRVLRDEFSRSICAQCCQRLTIGYICAPSEPTNGMCQLLSSQIPAKFSDSSYFGVELPSNSCATTCNNSAPSPMNQRYCKPSHAAITSGALGGWCPTIGCQAVSEQYLQLDFGNRYYISDIIVQGCQILDFFVEAFTISHSETGAFWTAVDKVFRTGHTSSWRISTCRVTERIYARYLRLFLLEYHSVPCIRVEVILNMKCA